MSASMSATASSPHTGDVVKYESLSGSYATRFQGGGRVIFD